MSTMLEDKNWRALHKGEGILNEANNNVTRITVVVAVYNGAKTLQTCLDSINGQTHQIRELIIIDGGSTDGTVEIVKKNSLKISYWESSPDRGIYHAWNKALTHATGDWVYFLGADDVLHDQYVLEKFVSKMREVAIPPLVAYGKIEYCKGDKRRVMGEEWRKIRYKIKSGMYIRHQGMFHHKNLFVKCGRFDERYQIAGDYHLLLRSLRYDLPIFLGDFIIADQYAGGKSSERASRWKVLREFRAAQKEMGLPLTIRWVWEYTKAQMWRCFMIKQWWLSKTAGAR